MSEQKKGPRYLKDEDEVVLKEDAEERLEGALSKQKQRRRKKTNEKRQRTKQAREQRKAAQALNEAPDMETPHLPEDVTLRDTTATNPTVLPSGAIPQGQDAESIATTNIPPPESLPPIPGLGQDDPDLNPQEVYYENQGFPIEMEVSTLPAEDLDAAMQVMDALGVDSTPIQKELFSAGYNEDMDIDKLFEEDATMTELPTPIEQDAKMTVITEKQRMADQARQEKQRQKDLDLEEKELAKEASEHDKMIERIERQEREYNAQRQREEEEAMTRFDREETERAKDGLDEMGADELIAESERRNEAQAQAEELRAASLEETKAIIDQQEADAKEDPKANIRDVIIEGRILRDVQRFNKMNKKMIAEIQDGIATVKFLNIQSQQKLSDKDIQHRQSLLDEAHNQGVKDIIIPLHRQRMTSILAEVTQYTKDMHDKYRHYLDPSMAVYLYPTFRDPDTFNKVKYRTDENGDPLVDPMTGRPIIESIHAVNRDDAARLAKQRAAVDATDIPAAYFPHYGRAAHQYLSKAEFSYMGRKFTPKGKLRPGVVQPPRMPQLIQQLKQRIGSALEINHIPGTGDYREFLELETLKSAYERFNQYTDYQYKQDKTELGQDGTLVDEEALMGANKLLQQVTAQKLLEQLTQSKRDDARARVGAEQKLEDEEMGLLSRSAQSAPPGQQPAQQAPEPSGEQPGDATPAPPNQPQDNTINLNPLLNQGSQYNPALPNNKTVERTWAPPQGGLAPPRQRTRTDLREDTEETKE